ncbi:prepilin peptidase [Vibrio sp. JPW-9-11-11]|nr:prepilin peptidase [Vibrio sp. JPW-9-11-11]
MNYLIWLGFIAIAINDAKEHRIPNSFLLVVLSVCLVNVLFQPHPLDGLITALSGGLALFFCALLLHFARVMAPGDVKLLGVVGFWLGWGSLLPASAWIGFASVVVGLLYAALNRVITGASIKELLTKYSLMAAYGSQTNALVAGKDASEHKLRMPFAPVVVMGLALFHYF